MSRGISRGIRIALAPAVRRLAELGLGTLGPSESGQTTLLTGHFGPHLTLVLSVARDRRNMLPFVLSLHMQDPAGGWRTGTLCYGGDAAFARDQYLGMALVLGASRPPRVRLPGQLVAGLAGALALGPMALPLATLLSAFEQDGARLLATPTLHGPVFGVLGLPQAGVAAALGAALRATPDLFTYYAATGPTSVAVFCRKPA